MGVSTAEVQELADRHGVPADVLAAAVSEHFQRRADARREQHEERERRRREHPAPSSDGWYREVVEGRHRPRSRPESATEDREFVPGAVRHWRMVHGLTQAEALRRIGHSPRAGSWSAWEAGTKAPPYRVLLLMLAATGLGHWIDHDARSSLGDPLSDLRHASGQVVQAHRARRAESQARRELDRRRMLREREQLPPAPID